MYKIKPRKDGYELYVVSPESGDTALVEPDLTTMDGVISSIVHHEKEVTGEYPSVTDLEITVDVQ